MDRLALTAILLITPIAVLVIVSRDALNDPQDEFAHGEGFPIIEGE